MRARIRLFLLGSALLTFLLSAVGAFPPALVESWYSRRIFPGISYATGLLADGAGFSWLDPALIAAILILAVSIWRRRPAWLFLSAAAAYLLFFWGWGLNYHRVGLEVKLLAGGRIADAEELDQFVSRAIAEINRLHAEKSETPISEDILREEVSGRVRLVVGRIDGAEWRSAGRIKSSILANWWFRAAGIDGLFNPFAHEPIVNSRLLDIERPFAAAHELAHVRGYPVEGDANLIAVLATILSGNSNVQYSGWINLWMYIRTPELDRLLDEGPRRDVSRILDRARTDQIAWVSSLQRTVLDWYLKANSVEEGIRSYSAVVVLAASTQSSWDRFR